MHKMNKMQSKVFDGLSMAKNQECSTACIDFQLFLSLCRVFPNSNEAKPLVPDHLLKIWQLCWSPSKEPVQPMQGPSLVRRSFSHSDQLFSNAGTKCTPART